MSDDPNFRPELKNKARQAFSRANPERYGKVVGNPDATSSLRTLEHRSTDLKQRMRSHFKKYQEVWVAREAIKVWQDRAALRAKHPSPIHMMSNRLASDEIMKQARLNVRRRMARRLSNVNQIKTRMENSVVRTQSFAQQNRELSLGRSFPQPPKPTQRLKRSF